MGRSGNAGLPVTRSLVAVCALLSASACANIGDPAQSDATPENRGLYYVSGDTFLLTPDENISTKGPFALHRISNGRNRYGTMDVSVYKKAILQRRPKRLTFRVDRRSIARGFLNNNTGKISFRLPKAINDPTACYVVLQGNRPQPTRRQAVAIFQNLSPQDYAVSLQPFVEQQAREANLRKLEAQLKIEEDNLARTLKRIDAADKRLKTSTNLRSGKCMRVAPILPRKPKNHMTTRQAKRIASGIYVQFLAHKYKCSGAVWVVEQLSKNNEFMRTATNIGGSVCDTDAFLAAFGFGFIENKFARLIPRNEWSPLIDIWEAIVARCAFKGDRGCQAVLAGTLLLRAESDIGNLTDRLLIPTRRWHAAINQANRHADQQVSQCRSDQNLVANRKSTMAAATKKALEARAVASLERQFVAERRSSVFPASVLQCSTISRAG